MTPMTLRAIILEKIAELGWGTLDAFFPETYSHARIWRKFLGLDPTYKFSRQTFSVILSKLRAEGLVERKNAKRQSQWRVTNKGLESIRGYREDMVGPKPDGIMRIVSFDIPEPQRKMRRWIREALLEHGYNHLQKSVWVGYTPLSNDFIKELDTAALKKCVHIFSVDKKGTLAFERNV